MRRIHLGGLLVVGAICGSAMLLGHNRSSASTGLLKPAGSDFVVTNANDAGPGTLRDAIMAADRLSNRAHIIVKVKRIAIESALPALINPHGVSIEAEADGGVIDAARQSKGGALQISSPDSSLRGLHFVNAHDVAIVVNASNVSMDDIAIADSNIGILLGAAAKGCTFRTSVFERNEIAVKADPEVRGVVITSSIFRNNRRAGFWFIGAEAKAMPNAPHVDADTESNADRQSVKIIGTVFEKNGSGVVLANRPVLIQKSRFIGNEQSAVLLLGGIATVEDNEIRNSGGTAVSVTAGRHVVVARNTFVDNPLTAIMTRDSQVTVEHNTLQGGGYGIVAIQGPGPAGTVIRDNTVTKSSGDAITVIGGSPLVSGNQVHDNRGAGLRILDFVQAGGGLKATPKLEANVVKNNGVDMPAIGIYKLAEAAAR